MDGEPAAELSSERLPWPGEETVGETSRAPRSTRRSGRGARATSTGATDRLPADASVTLRDTRRAPPALRGARGARRRERAARPGRRRHLPRRARRDRARRSCARPTARARSTSSSCTATSTCAARRSSSGPRRSSAGRLRTCSTGSGAGDEEQPALISLTGNPDPDLLADLDPALVGRVRAEGAPRCHTREHQRPARELDDRRRAERRAGRRRSSGSPTSSGCGTPSRRATRLDEPDPVAAWRAHARRSQARADALNARGFDALRFRGPGTDLTVGLIPGARWLCATLETAAGIEHIPNMPTEEVFTSPDWRRAEGRVRST